jgi:Phospholipase_D-nuclease N-terminal
MLAMFNLGGGEIMLLLVCLPITLFCLWMLISAIQNKGLSDSEKTGWVLAIFALTIVGAVLYYFVGYPKRLTPGPGG